jgi:hypothetical protein
MSWAKLPADPIELREHIRRVNEKAIENSLREAREMLERDGEIDADGVAAALVAIERGFREMAARDAEAIIRRSTH